MALIPGPDHDEVDLTPPSRYAAPPPPPPSAAPEPLSPTERTRLFEAARRASIAWPGPVGELVAREIRVYMEWGFRFGHASKVRELVEQAEKAPIPT